MDEILCFLTLLTAFNFHKTFHIVHIETCPRRCRQTGPSSADNAPHSHYLSQFGLKPASNTQLFVLCASFDSFMREKYLKRNKLHTLSDYSDMQGFLFSHTTLNPKINVTTPPPVHCSTPPNMTLPQHTKLTVARYLLR